MSHIRDKSNLGKLIIDTAQNRHSRRDVLKRALGIGLSVPAIGALLAACETDEDVDVDDDDDEPVDDDTDDEPMDDDEDDSEPAVEVDDDDTEPSRQIVIAMSVEPESLENWMAYSTDGHPIIRNVQEALLNRDPETNELVGELATDWELVDDDTWRFNLREGVTFHNGDPFNAEVAAFGINYTWSEENAFAMRTYIGPEMHAEAVDEYTVDVTTESPDPVLPSRLYFSPIPNMNQIQERPESLPDEPIGTGPYQLVEWARGQHIRLTANPDWWGHTAEDSYGEVRIQDVEFVVRAESTVRAGMVSTGEAHIGRFLSPEDCESTPQCLEMPSVEVLFLRLDTMHHAMSDIRVRQAIALAIDREAIAEEFFGGGEPESQLVSEAAFGYNPDLEPYPYDMERARELVEEAAADGVAVDAQITVANRSGIYLRHDEYAEYIANQLNEAGLNATSQVFEVAQFNEQFLLGYDEVDEDRGWITTNPHSNELLDLSATASSYYICPATPSTYCNEEVDAALDEALPLVGEEREEALQELTRMVYEDYAFVPVITMPLFYGLTENLNWNSRLDAFMLVKEMSFD